MASKKRFKKGRSKSDRLKFKSAAKKIRTPPRSEEKFIQKEFERLRRKIPKDVMGDRALRDLARKSTVFNPWRYSRVGAGRYKDKVTGKIISGDMARKTFRKLRGERIVINIKNQEGVSKKDARRIYHEIIKSKGERAGLWYIIRVYGTN